MGWTDKVYELFLTFSLSLGIGKETFKNYFSIIFERIKDNLIMSVHYDANFQLFHYLAP